MWPAQNVTCLTLSSLILNKLSLNVKQFGSRSDAELLCIWSGFKLFAKVFKYTICEYQEDIMGILRDNFSKIVIRMANGTDLDQKTGYVPSDLGLHCLYCAFTEWTFKQSGITPSLFSGKKNSSLKIFVVLTVFFTEYSLLWLSEIESSLKVTEVYLSIYQSVWTLIRCRAIRHLIRLHTVCKGVLYICIHS